MASEETASQKMACNHCGQMMSKDQNACPRCGMLSPPAQDKKTKEIQKKFILYFVLIVIFCISMVLWLPPDWIN